MRSIRPLSPAAASSKRALLVADHLTVLSMLAIMWVAAAILLCAALVYLCLNKLFPGLAPMHNWETRYSMSPHAFLTKPLTEMTSLDPPEAGNDASRIPSRDKQERNLRRVDRRN